MSALITFRDHARRMSEAQHAPDCPSLGPAPRPIWAAIHDANGELEALAWRGMTPAPPTCDGCVSDSDRALFAQLAGEIDDYLAPQVDLFGEVREEPETTREDA